MTSALSWFIGYLFIAWILGYGVGQIFLNLRKFIDKVK